MTCERSWSKVRAANMTLQQGMTDLTAERAALQASLATAEQAQTLLQTTADEQRLEIERLRAQLIVLPVLPSAPHRWARGASAAAKGCRSARPVHVRGRNGSATVGSRVKHIDPLDGESLLELFEAQKKMLSIKRKQAAFQFSPVAGSGQEEVLGELKAQ